MTESVEKLRELLATAMEMEEQGRVFYEKAARQCDNELGQEIFNLLKDYEIVHKNRIKKIADAIDGGKGWTDAWHEVEPIEEIPLIFKKLAESLKEKVKAGTRVEALELGMKFESESIIFYDKLMTGATDPAEKRFAEQMVTEEREHYRILADLEEFYLDPEAWLMEKERLTLDGA